METTQNFFELFGLPVSFEVDIQQLSERYRDLQRAVHPDKFANASDRERRLAVEKAAQINEAFQTLKSPMNRARYMLEIRGVDFDNERDTHLDPMFLMEQMELREALGEERVVAYDMPGTTRDSIYLPFERQGQKYTLIDTAGIPPKCNCVKLSVK